MPLPELHPGCGPPDVVIRLKWLRRREAPDDAQVMSVYGDAVIFNLEQIRFTASRGEEINIRAPEGKEENDIRIWLLGTVMAALLHQRGYLPLHANTVQLASGGVAAFAGPSGAGKSTMATLLEKAKFRVLGDDLCAIRFDHQGLPTVFAGIPRLKLWGETLDLFGRKRAGLERVASDLLKFHVPLASASEEGQLNPLALERLYILGERSDPEDLLIERLSGAAAAKAILDNAFRWGIGQAVRGSSSRVQFDQCLAIARSAAIFKVARRWGIGHLFKEGQAIADALATPLAGRDTTDCAAT